MDNRKLAFVLHFLMHIRLVKGLLDGVKPDFGQPIPPPSVRSRSILICSCLIIAPSPGGSDVGMYAEDR